MQIKITGKTPELLDGLVSRVMNLACVVARYGTIPDESDMNLRDRGLIWQYRTEEKKYDLFPANNNAWAFVRNYGEGYITLEFSFRYDKPGSPLATALTHLIAARWPDDCEILNL